jgi:hypothetical protein
MATTEKNENKTKVLVNVYEPLIHIMKRKFDAACLKRDAYLDKALKIESTYLRKEVTTSNSDKAKSYIADNLKQLRLKPLNLLLSAETVELMNEVCKEKNIPRDAFINRVFLLLIASDSVIAVLFNDEKMKVGDDTNYLDYVNEFVCEEARFYNRSNVLDTIEEFVEISPFWRLRAVFDDDIWDGLYCYVFKKTALNKLPNDYDLIKTDNILGFNTFMTDDEVFEQEDLDKPISVKRAELDKLLAIAKQEKKTRSAKTKPSGEAQ